MHRLRDALRACESAVILHGCDSVGRGTTLDGRPFVDNHGEIVIGENVAIGSIPVRSHLVTGPAGHIHVGAGVRIAHGASLCSHAGITIGEGTVIGPFVTIVDVDFHEIQHRDSIGQARPITIGRNVTIGAGAVILRGAVVEDDVVVEPSSVVARRMPTGARVSGIPARPTLIPMPSHGEGAP